MKPRGLLLGGSFLVVISSGLDAGCPLSARKKSVSFLSVPPFQNESKQGDDQKTSFYLLALVNHGVSHLPGEYRRHNVFTIRSNNHIWLMIVILSGISR